MSLGSNIAEQTGTNRNKKEGEYMNISFSPIKDGARYFIMTDDGHSICYFDSLAKAGLVMRYLQGADMPPDDCARAVDIMRLFDKDAAARAAEREAKRAKKRAAYEKGRAAQEARTAAEKAAEQPPQEGEPDVKPE